MFSRSSLVLLGLMALTSSGSKCVAMGPTCEESRGTIRVPLLLRLGSGGRVGMGIWISWLSSEDADEQSDLSWFVGVTAASGSLMVACLGASWSRATLVTRSSTGTSRAYPGDGLRIKSVWTWETRNMRRCRARLGQVWVGSVRRQAQSLCVVVHSCSTRQQLIKKRSLNSSHRSRTRSKSI